jgi:hypothetical protein
METDEEYASLVLRALDEPRLDMSTVDIGRAMTEGRRRRRIRRIAGLVSVGTATALVLVGVPVATGALRHGGPPAVAATQTGVPFPAGTASVAAQPPRRRPPAQCTGCPYRPDRR